MLDWNILNPLLILARTLGTSFKVVNKPLPLRVPVCSPGTEQVSGDRRSRSQDGTNVLWVQFYVVASWLGHWKKAPLPLPGPGSPHCAQSLSCVWLFVTQWTVAHQGSLSMKFSMQEYQSGLPFPTLGNRLNPGIESESLGSSALAGGFFYHCTSREAISYRLICLYNSGSSHLRN